MKTPAFQAPPQGVPSDTGLASRYRQLIPAVCDTPTISPNKRQKADTVQQTFTQQQTDTAVARCQHYIGSGIPDKHVTPFQEDWAVNAVSMLPQQEW